LHKVNPISLEKQNAYREGFCSTPDDRVNNDTTRFLHFLKSRMIK
jgi:hypothetical protein